MASSSSLAHFNLSDGRDRGLETIEIDPQYALSLGFTEGDVVRFTTVHGSTSLLIVYPLGRGRAPP